MSNSDKKIENHKDEVENLIKRKKEENEALRNILEKLKAHPLKSMNENKKNK